MNTFSILNPPEPIPERRRRPPLSTQLLWALLFLALTGALILSWSYLLGGLPGTVARADWPGEAPAFRTTGLSAAEMGKQLARLRRKNKRMQRVVRSYAPRGVFIVIDTARNRLYLKKQGRVLLDAICSTGSGQSLPHPTEDREWVFDTPRGEFHVQGKLRHPLWRKPDWAFIEEGEPVPRDEEERFERGVLGDYGLAFGDGYFIHGTLYTRFLGRSVTHGCVRLGDEDLEFLFRKAPVETPIFIF